MKDIKINSNFKRIIYGISWVGFIGGGFLIAWLIAIGLASYAIDTQETKPKIKGLLNKTYQKFIWVYGIIAGAIIIILEGFSLFQFYQNGFTYPLKGVIGDWIVPLIIFIIAYSNCGIYNETKHKENFS